MRYFTRMLRFVAMLLVAVSSMLTQPVVNPSGHWEGTVQAPEMTLQIEIDFVQNSKGEITGAFSQPSQGVKGLPISSIAFEGRTFRFIFKGGPEASTFEGTLSEDGQSMSGTVSLSGFSAPFNLTRTGDARIATAPKNARIGNEFEGVWNGTLDLTQTQMHVVVRMANQPDGSAIGTVMSPDGTGVEIPIGITQSATRISIDVAQVGASFVGELNAEGTEIAGKWTQQGATLPLTLRRTVK